MRSYDSGANKSSGRVEGIVSPVRGLNKESPLAGLSQQYAITLDNWICQPDGIVTRQGAANHATGFTQAPRTLMTYSAGAVAQMFAAASNGIFNVSAAGAIGASVATVTAGDGKSVNFATSAGQFLYFVNGTDKPQLYDGTTWVAVDGVSVPAITGITTTSITDVETYRQRLYFLQQNFLGFWYLPADSVGGAAAAFRVGSLCRLGGRVVAHGTWSIDGGSGPDDHYVLATSQGEVLIFRGSDPAVTANWNYIGTYYVGKPIGQKCLTKLGGDLLFLCENGLIPLSKLLQSTGLNYTQALTSVINPAIAVDAAAYGAVNGWKILVIPRYALILLNVPQSTALSNQYVFSTRSRGWSTFSGWNAADFIEFEGKTYFTTGLVVANAFTGTADFGANITAICDTSYARFNTRKQLYPANMRALFAANGPVGYTLGIAQDFTNNYALNEFPTVGSEVALWDTGLWDIALWGDSFGLRNEWVTVAARGGIALSTRFQISSKYASVVLLNLDFNLLEQGLIF